MKYQSNRLTLLPHEVEILEKADRLREPRVEYSETIKPLMNEIFNTASKVAGSALEHFSGLQFPRERESITLTCSEAVQEIPAKLAKLAREALERETSSALATEGSIKVRRNLAVSLEALVADPNNKVLEVYCLDYTEPNKKV